MITGYSWPEVLAIPRMTGPDHLEYLRRATTDLAEKVRAMSNKGATVAAPAG